MSVLACDRNGCENVMCDRLSIEFGYLCNECFEELVSRGIVASDGIRIFMSTKPSHRLKEATEAYYDKIFPLRQ